MRFGKKLALQVTDDQSGAPYLSHKLMKEAINRIVRELRQYQSRVQSNEQAWRGSAQPAEAAASPEELQELEACVSALDHQLFDLVDEDLSRILEHVRFSEAFLVQNIGTLQSAAIQAGMLIEDSQIQKLEQSLPVKPESKMVLCQQILELRMRSEPMEVKNQLEDLSTRYNETVDVANKHSQYLEINVAGFRKLLKRHEKQIPQHFHARPTPFFGFHRLVTHSSRQLLEVVRQFGAALEDARDRLVNVTNSMGSQCVVQLPLHELKSLGAECQMVLEIQKQLKDVGHPCLVAAPGMLYPKPGSEIMAPVQGEANRQLVMAPQTWNGPAAGVEGGQVECAGVQQEDIWHFLRCYPAPGVDAGALPAERPEAPSWYTPSGSAPLTSTI